MIKIVTRLTSSLSKVQSVVSAGNEVCLLMG